MKLQIGMRVLIKDDEANFKEDANTVKIITGHLPPFRGQEAFELDYSNGIWCIEDFVHCVDYPDLPLEERTVK